MSDRTERRVIRAEATLLRVPLFALAVKGSASLDGFEFRHSRRKGEKTVESVVRTERDAKAPYPGPLSRRTHMALLSLAADAGFPFENSVTWTWRALCRRMGLPNSGRRVGEIKGALRATWGLRIHGLSAIDGRSRETWRRLYAECSFLNEARADGSTADANRLWFAPWYVESLNALHSAPVDYERWKRLEKVGPLASRLYEYLVPAFYKRESLELAYDRLTAAMPVVAESRRSHALRQFAPALAALQAEGLVAGSAWDAMKGTGRPKLLLTRGPALAPGGPSPGLEAEGAAVAAADDAPERFAAEFYRLLGKEARPLRSDLAVARDLVARFGADRAPALLPEAVRLLKSRFRNAETMGALVRYFEEAARESDRRRDDDARRDREASARADDRAALADGESRRQALWAALPERERAQARAAVLAEQPQWKKFPGLLEAACLARMEPDGED